MESDRVLVLDAGKVSAKNWSFKASRSMISHDMYGLTDTFFPGCRVRLAEKFVGQYRYVVLFTCSGGWISMSVAL